MNDQAPNLFQITEKSAEFIASQFRGNRDFRMLSCGGSVVPSLQCYAKHWLDFSTGDTTAAVLMHSGREFIGVGYLDDIDQANRSARCHISTWKFTKRLPALVKMLKIWYKYDLGLDTIYGMTPEWNKAAVSFVLKSGFQKVGKIPNMYKHPDFSETAAIITTLDLNGKHGV